MAYSTSVSPTRVPTWRSGPFWYCCELIFCAIVISGATEVGAKYLLKDGFELRPTTIAFLNLVIHLPWYLGFAAGAVRDRWRPFGKSDQRIAFWGPVVVASCQIVCFASGGTPFQLISSLVLLTIATVAYGAVTIARIGTIAKHTGLTGQVGAMMSVVPFIAYALMKLLTGLVIPLYGFGGICLASSILSLLCMTASRWRPPDAMSVTADSPSLRKESIMFAIAATVKRVTPIVVLVALIAGLWCFTPGWKTPLFFTLTNGRGLNQQQYEWTQSLSDTLNAASAGTYLWLWRRYRLRSLLYAGLLLGIIGCCAIVPARSYASTCLACAVFGASCGLGNASVNDLMIRVAPPRNEGLSLMLALSGVILFTDVSDLAGTALYEHGGFGLAMLISAAVPAGLLFAVARLPKEIADKSDEGVRRNTW